MKGFISMVFEMGGAVAGKLCNLPGMLDGFTKGVAATVSSEVVAECLDNSMGILDRALPLTNPKSLAKAIKSNEDFKNKVLAELNA